MGPAYKVFFGQASGLYSKTALCAGSARQAELSRQHEGVRMRGSIGVSLVLLLTLTGGGAAQSPGNQAKASGMEADVTKIKQAMLGNWESIAPEVRPSAAKNADGSLKPFYLKRAFQYLPSDRFKLEIVNSADPNGAVPLARIKIVGHMLWQGPHPIATGAQKVDFVADEAYEVTPLAQGFADVLNKVAGVRPLWSQGGHELHGVRPRLPQERPPVLGRAQYRRPRLRYRAEPADQPADSAGPEVART
jgi:hypothetical protein